MINILIIDDHPLFREGLKKTLETEPEMTVVGELNHGSQIFNILKEKKVDLILLDIKLPGRDGLDVLKDIKKVYPQIPILILSMHSEERYAIRALKVGAAGYQTKETVPEELIKAIKKVISGGKYISASLAEKLAEEIEDARDKPPHQTLSNREYQVLILIASGKNVQEISNELMLSMGTIYTHRARILKKMHMSSDADLIHYAIRNNLID